MSKNDGIYVLRTMDKQYRVVYAEEIENIYYNEDKERYEFEPLDSQLYLYFKDSKVTNDAEKALYVADKMNTIDRNGTKDGIKIIMVNKFWKEIFKNRNN